MGQIRASQQWHITVSRAEHEMVQKGQKPAETRPDHQTATCPTRQEGQTHSLAELHSHRTHGEEMPHIGQTGSQVEPGTMKRSTYGHQVRSCSENTAKNAPKAFIVGHL